MNASVTSMQKAKDAVNANKGFVAGETLPGLLKKDEVKKRFEEVLGKKSAGFVSSIMTLYNSNRNFSEVNPNSILSAAMIAATLDLPINANLGFAHIVAYSGVAQFQMGWKGFVQLAIRTGQYRTINAAVVYEGELKSYNRFTGEVELDPEGKKSDKVVGFYSFFRLINGFEKSLYMTIEEVTAHGKKYSKSFATGQWQKDFNSMALKTVVKMLLGKWGILSIDLQKAMAVDQGVIVDISNTESIQYPDAPENETEAHQEPIKQVKQPSALDVRILQAKKEAGDDVYSRVLGEDMSVTSIDELSELDKEVFLRKLQEKIKK